MECVSLLVWSSISQSVVVDLDPTQHSTLTFLFRSIPVSSIQFVTDSSSRKLGRRWRRMDIQLVTLDRLPLPSLRVYAGLSVLAASSSLYYIWTEFQLLSFRHHLHLGSIIPDQDQGLDLGGLRREGNALNLPLPGGRGNVTGGDFNSGVFTWEAVIAWASQQPHCVWVRSTFIILGDNASIYFFFTNIIFWESVIWSGS